MSEVLLTAAGIVLATLALDRLACTKYGTRILGALTLIFLIWVLVWRIY